MWDLSGMRVAMIAGDGVEQVELTEPLRALREAHAEVSIISPKGGEVQGFKTFDKADRFKADLSFEDFEANDFDAVMLPGGALNADMIRVDDRLKTFLKNVQQAGKPIAAICHAPWELVSAGIVRNRKLTSYYTLQDDIRNAGGTWIDAEVVVDDNLVTSRQPDDIPAFNAAMLKMFAKQRGKSRRPGEREAESQQPRL